MIKPLSSKGEIIEYKKELVAIILSSAKAINESTKKKWQIQKFKIPPCLFKFLTQQPILMP
jgi:hypothetical protein